MAADVNLGKVDGLTYIADQTAPIPSPGIDSTQAQCPGGTRLVGGGARIPGFGAGAHLNSLDPNTHEGSPGGFQAWIYNNSGTSQTATVHAVCEQGGTAKFRKSPSATESAPDAVAVKARCSRTEHVSGGGAFVTGDSSEAFVNSSFPIDGHDSDGKPDDGWRVRVQNRAGLGKEVTAYAICSQAERVYRRFEHPLDPGDEVGFLGDCGPTRHVISGGVRMTGPAGEAVMRTVDHYDSGDTDAAPDDGVDVNLANSGGGTAKTATVFAVCDA